jgi:hypothetical protein
MWKPIREEPRSKRSMHGHLLPPGICHEELLVLHQPLQAGTGYGLI